MGWIFFKSQYERMATIDRDDLEGDIGSYMLSDVAVMPISNGPAVVQLQHKYYSARKLLLGSMT